MRLVALRSLKGASDFMPRARKTAPREREGVPMNSVQLEFAVDRLDLGRLDQLAMRDRDRMQDAFQRFLPEAQEALQFREMRAHVVFLPDVGLQEPGMVGTPVQ